MEILPIPCLSDNYAYLLVCTATGEAAVVDPSEAEPVIRAVHARGIQLTAILNTHHHHDHVGGNDALLARYGALPVYGHVSDRGRIPGQTVGLHEGDTLAVGTLRPRVLHVPGHTLGAVAYVVDDAVFTGDTLFIAGCGRLFEGTPAMMHASLSHKLAALDPATRVYCGHEYTVKNLEFAAHVEPGNHDVTAALGAARATRAAGSPTVPSTIARERSTNPFLRVDSPAVRATVGADGDAVAVFAAVRKAKDTY